jgi:hypothetical protein
LIHLYPDSARDLLWRPLPTVLTTRPMGSANVAAIVWSGRCAGIGIDVEDYAAGFLGLGPGRITSPPRSVGALVSYDPQQAYSQRPPVVSGPPAQPYSGPPAGYYPPYPPPVKRKKWPWILGGIALVMILGCVGVFALIGAGAKSAVESIDANEQGKNAVPGQMNKGATDGRFQFTVTGMECGASSVGPDGFGQKAQGEFCLVSVTIKNIGKDAESSTTRHRRRTTRTAPSSRWIPAPRSTRMRTRRRFWSRSTPATR